MGLTRAFGETRIRPMDWDGVVEANGHLLVFETKHPGTPVPGAQRDALYRAVQIPKSVTVILLEGKALGKFVTMSLWALNSRGVVIQRPPQPVIDQREVYQQVARWFRHVDPRRAPKESWPAA